MTNRFSKQAESVLSRRPVLEVGRSWFVTECLGAPLPLALRLAQFSISPWGEEIKLLLSGSRLSTLIFARTTSEIGANGVGDSRPCSEGNRQGAPALASPDPPASHYRTSRAHVSWPDVESYRESLHGGPPTGQLPFSSHSFFVDSISIISWDAIGPQAGFNSPLFSTAEGSYLCFFTLSLRLAA